MRSYKKQSGESLISYLIIIVVLVVAIYGYNRIFRSELYDKENEFKSHYIKNGKVFAQIRYLKWYDNDDSTSYYIFTEKGKLYVEGSNHYGWWNPDEKFYDILEEHQGMFCTMSVEDSFLHSWSITQISNCIDENDFYQKMKDGEIDINGNKFINEDVPFSTKPNPFQSDVPESTPAYSYIPD
jgi:hypothetical protein